MIECKRPLTTEELQNLKKFNDLPLSVIERIQQAWTDKPVPIVKTSYSTWVLNLINPAIVGVLISKLLFGGVVIQSLVGLAALSAVLVNVLGLIVFVCCALALYAKEGNLLERGLLNLFWIKRSSPRRLYSTTISLFILVLLCMNGYLFTAILVGLLDLSVFIIGFGVRENLCEKFEKIAQEHRNQAV